MIATSCSRTSALPIQVLLPGHEKFGSINDRAMPEVPAGDDLRDGVAASERSSHAADHVRLSFMQ
jgi:hypothetical protein